MVDLSIVGMHESVGETKPRIHVCVQTLYVWESGLRKSTHSRQAFPGPQFFSQITLRGPTRQRFNKLSSLLTLPLSKLYLVFAYGEIACSIRIPTP